MPRAPAGPARRHCFTLWLPEELANDDVVAQLTAVAEAWVAEPPEACRFFVCQVEHGETPRPHIQGYAEFTRSVRFSHFHRHFHPRVSCRLSRGTAEENVSYCTKEDHRLAGPWTHGTPTTQGKRSDLEALHTSISEGNSTLELWEAHFPAMAKYHRAVREYQAVKARAASMLNPAGTEGPLPDLEVHLYWGDPGCGKTRRARFEAHNPYIASITPDGKNVWFDGYEPGQDIIVDDFSGGLSIGYLKRLFDRYPIDLSYKGGMVPRSCRRMFITANEAPEAWYPDQPQVHIDALRRRFTSVTHYTSILPWVPPPDQLAFALPDDVIVPGTPE